MVTTKEELDKLRSERPTPNVTLDYTIGGAIEQNVHSCVDAERIGKLNRGDRTMAKASDKVQQAAKQNRDGYDRAQFNKDARPRPQAAQPRPAPLQEGRPRPAQSGRPRPDQKLTPKFERSR